MTVRVPTRYPKGVTNVESFNRFNLLGFPDPTQWITYFNDFCSGKDALPNATDEDYVVTKVGAGTIAQTDGLGGLSLLTNAAADDNSVFVQKKGEAFRWAADKKLIFGCRFKASDAVDSDVVIGLQLTDTTPLDVTDGIFFLKADDAANIAFIVEKDNTQLSTNVAVLAADTFIELAFVYDPRKCVNVAGTVTRVFDVYVDGVLVTSVQAAATVPDDEDLCISFGVQNGAAAAKTLTIDWVFAALERS